MLQLELLMGLRNTPFCTLLNFHSKKSQRQKKAVSVRVQHGGIIVFFYVLFYVHTLGIGVTDIE